MALRPMRMRTPQRWLRHVIWLSAEFFCFQGSRGYPPSSTPRRRHGNLAGRHGATISMRCSAMAHCPQDFESSTISRMASATSIKSIDLNAVTYQDATRLTYRLTKYIGVLVDYEGAIFSNTQVKLSEIRERVLNLVIPKGSMTATQRAALEAARIMATTTGRYPVKIILTPL